MLIANFFKANYKVFKRKVFIMKKILILSMLVVFSAPLFAAEDIAVVDLNQIVGNSSQVKQLKTEHSKRIADLDKILVNARGEISNESDPAKVLLIEDRYMNEFNAKKEALERDYNNKLSAIERSIKSEIEKKAEKDGYDYVFAKSVVLYGGKDITQELLNTVK